MGYLEEQIKQRKSQDNQLFSDSLRHLANSVLGLKSSYNQDAIISDTFDEILSYYHLLTSYTLPDNVDSFFGKLDYLCSKVGLVYREVKLINKWYKGAFGAFIAFRKDNGNPVALIPCLKGYKFINDGKYEVINEKNASLFEVEAICFYRSFPNHKLTISDLTKFAFSSVSLRTYVIITVVLLVSTLLGLLVPKIFYFLYGKVINSQDNTLLLSTIIFFLCLSFSNIFVDFFLGFFSEIVNTKIKANVEAATMQRLFALRIPFFRKFSSGELANRSEQVNVLTTGLFDILFNSTISTVFSLIYITAIKQYAPSLVTPSIIVILISAGFSIFVSLISISISRKKMEALAKESGVAYSIVSGIQKIRIAGAEKRFFSKWADTYSKAAGLTYAPPGYIKYSTVVAFAISLVGSFVMYYYAIKSNVSVAEYGAFIAAYGMVFGAFQSLSNIAISIAEIKPTYDIAKPILDAELEKSCDKEIVKSIMGNIELNNVTFRYDENMPFIFNRLTFRIKAGEYVAFVGKTGCGKSTLVKLLLGLEKPLKGAIYYDGKDLSALNLKSLRSKIGTVMQDGELFQGDIYSNISICAPELTLEEAFNAADIAGIGDDIREMPMGMSTLISDGGGGISGGQKQRILIARAIAPKPKILIFDEATSALDNVTQRKVSDALNNLQCTRIVIAHRLSTIKQCDRIIFFEDGKITEEGTYDELIKKNGSFAELVNRQMVEQ